MFDSMFFSMALGPTGSAELGAAVSVSAPKPIRAAAANQYGFIMDLICYGDAEIGGNARYNEGTLRSQGDDNVTGLATDNKGEGSAIFAS